MLSRLGLAPNEYVLATIHRAENTDAGPRLRSIFAGLNAVADAMPVVLPFVRRHPGRLDVAKSCSRNAGRTCG